MKTPPARPAGNSPIARWENEGGSIARFSKPQSLPATMQPASVTSTLAQTPADVDKNARGTRAPTPSPKGESN